MKKPRAKKIYAIRNIDFMLFRLWGLKFIVDATIWSKNNTNVSFNFYPEDEKNSPFISIIN
jgi:hypothetical protein